MDIPHLIPILDSEADALDVSVRAHPALRAFFSHDFAATSREKLRASYLQLLKMKADYVRYSVPMLRAAGESLRGGDAEDRRWSGLFLDYAAGETDEQEGYGHHVWALADMRALGASPAELEAPPDASIAAYKRYLIDDARLHPYAILGTKGVLEHLSIRMSDDLVDGVLKSRIENAPNAISFFHHHGALDIDHVRSGDQNLEQIKDPEKRFQVLQGAYFTSGCYRTFLFSYLSS